MAVATQEELRIIARLVDQTIKPLNDIQKRLVKTEKAGAKAGDKIRKSFGKVASVLSGNVLSSVAKLAGAFAAFRTITSSIQDAREFSTAMSEVATIVDTTTVSMDGMEKAVLRIAKANGENEAIVARGLYQAISSGAKAGAEATKLLATASNLAIAGITDTRTSVDLLTSAVNAYRSSSLTAARASDIIFKTVEKGKTTVSELGGSMGRVLPLSSSLGISFEEASAALATMTLGGLSTDEAATALRSTLASMLTVTEDGKKVLDEFGLSFDPAVVKSQGLANTLLDVKNKLGDNTLAIQTLFPNVRGLVGVLSLLNDGGIKFKEVLGDVTDSVGAAGDALKKRMLDPAFRLKRLLNEIRITFVQGIGGAALKAFENIEAQAGSFKKILGDMKVLAAALGGATQAALELVGRLLTKVADFIDQIGGTEQVAARIKQAMQILGKVIEGVLTLIITGFQGFFALLQSMPALFRAVRNDASLNPLKDDADELKEKIAELTDEMQRFALIANNPNSNAGQVRAAQAAFGRFFERRQGLQEQLNSIGGQSADAILQGVSDRFEAIQDQASAVGRDLNASIEAFMAPPAVEAAHVVGEKAAKAFVQKLVDSIREFERGRTFRQALENTTPPAGDTTSPPAALGPDASGVQRSRGSVTVAIISQVRDAYNGLVAKLVKMDKTMAAVAEKNKALFNGLRSFASGFGNAIGQWVGGFQSAKQALSDFARRFLAQIAQMIAQTAILKLIIAGLGGPNSRLGGAFKRAIGFSHGGVPGDNGAVARAGISSAATGSIPPSGRRLVQINEGPFRKEGILPLAPARMGGRNVLGVASAGGGGGGAQNTFIINAVDARSFVELAAGSPQELASIIISAAQSNPQIAAALGGGSAV